MAAHAARRVERLKRERPLQALRALPFYSRPVNPPPPAGSALIEIRFAGPDTGFRVPRERASAAEAASLAAESGAAGIIVNVERNFHAGDWEHLSAVRAARPDAYLIARDLFLDPYQLECARAFGADAVILDERIAGAGARGALAGAARDLGLGVLSESVTIRTFTP